MLLVHSDDREDPHHAAQLVAQLIEAHRAGDQAQEQQILQTLRVRHGLRIAFASALKGGLG